MERGTVRESVARGRREGAGYGTISVPIPAFVKISSNSE